MLPHDSPSQQPSKDDPSNPLSQYYQYTGRIGFNPPHALAFYYAGSYLSTCFQGTSAQAVFSDEGDWWSETGNPVGLILDGEYLGEKTLAKGEKEQVISIASDLQDTSHSLTLVKLKGPGAGSSTLRFHGLRLDPARRLTEPAPRPARKIEVYGDLVTEGESAACPPGTHDCGANSGWLSYANLLARLLQAEIHNVGIGGLAVRNGTGYYNGAQTGLEQSFNRLKPFGDFPLWDFSRFQPDLLIMAMGVNDASAGGFEDVPAWKETYKRIVREIVANYGNETPVLFTAAPVETNADQADPYIRQVADELREEGFKTFSYTFRFRTAGHPNRPESEAMAQELYETIMNQALCW